MQLRNNFESATSVALGKLKNRLKFLVPFTFLTHLRKTCEGYERDVGDGIVKMGLEFVCRKGVVSLLASGC